MRTIPIDKIDMVSNYTLSTWDAFSSLTSYLDRWLGSDNYDTLKALKMYNVTALRNYDGVRLWRCDEQGSPVNGQLLLFEAGKPKEYLPIVRNLWPYHDAQYHLGEAFFGGHLLMRNDKPVAVVEDELAAMLGSQIDDRFLWLAVGHGQNLTKSLLAQLLAFSVVLFPDSMALAFWQKIAEDFENVVCSPAFSEINIYKHFYKNRLQHPKLCN